MVYKKENSKFKSAVLHKEKLKGLGKYKQKQ